MVILAWRGTGRKVCGRGGLWDCMCEPVVRYAEIALRDIDGKRLEESGIILRTSNNNVNGGRAQIAA